MTGLVREIRAILLNPVSLRHRTVNASLWNIGWLAATQIIRLMSNLLMTRLLVPEAFGLVALIFTLHVGLAMLTDVGIAPGIVRSARGAEPGYLRTAWTFQILRSIVIALVIVALGAVLWLVQGRVHLGASVYADPALPGLVAASALLMLINGFASTALPLAERMMINSRLVLPELVSQIVGILGMIGFALVYPSAWALLCGSLIGTSLRTAWSHLLLPGPRMQLCWDRADAAEIWGFGKWTMGASMFGFLAGQGDRLILAALLDQRSFSFYAIAMVWVAALSDVLVRLGSGVGFAAISETWRERPEEVARIFARFDRIFGWLCSLGSALLFLLGGTVIGLLYPPAYHESGDMLAILALAPFLLRYSLHAKVLLTIGDSRSFLVATSIAALGICIIPVPAFHLFGEIGILFAVALNGLWTLPWVFWRTRHVVNLHYVRECGLVLLAIAIVLLRMAFFR